MKGLDYSAGRIPGRAVKTAGYDFVIRYVDEPANRNPKLITRDEYRDLLAAGVAVWLVFEHDTTDALGGYDRGVAYARRAKAGADTLGYDGVIFFCADMHLAREQIRTALAYLDGAASVLGRARVGCYGFWEFVDAAITQGKAAAYWQCGIRPDQADPVHVWQNNNLLGAVQVGGVECDVNELLRPIPEPAAHPATTAVSGPLGDNTMAINMGTWPAGANVWQVLSCPVGPEFLYQSGWLSLSTCDAPAPSVRVWFIATKNGEPDYLHVEGPFPLPRDVRRPLPIPAGTEQVTVHYTAPRPLGWCTELLTNQ
jgi:glycoside hydrolase-like protein